jgi:hypothetical protein
MCGRSLAFLVLITSACRAPSSARESDPAPAGGTATATAEADPAARALAERVLAEVGGADAWQRTRYLQWSFFGGRRHVFDKATGAWRLDDGDTVVLMNVETREGRVFEHGVEVVDPARKEEILGRAYGQWINDSYWMFLPWKLNDPGVNLRHAGEAQLAEGRKAQVLELTFDAVGLTPKNRYLVYVDDQTGRIAQWSYFADAADREPKLTMPWRGWQRFGDIWLCTDHGSLPGRGPSDWRIAVHEDLPRAVFTDPEQPAGL